MSVWSRAEVDLMERMNGLLLYPKGRDVVRVEGENQIVQHIFITANGSSLSEMKIDQVTLMVRDLFGGIVDLYDEDHRCVVEINVPVSETKVRKEVLDIISNGLEVNPDLFRVWIHLEDKGVMSFRLDVSPTPCADPVSVESVSVSAGVYVCEYFPVWANIGGLKIVVITDVTVVVRNDCMRVEYVKVKRVEVSSEEES